MFRFVQDRILLVFIFNCLVARALVTAKAKIDGDSQFESLRKGRPMQETEAKLLHRLAGVPLGPCGLDAVALFQQVQLSSCLLKLNENILRFYLVTR